MHTQTKHFVCTYTLVQRLVVKVSKEIMISRSNIMFDF